MGTQSYAEMFALIIGWQYYNIVYDVLTQTGIWVFPIIMLFLKSIVESTKKFDSAQGTQATLRVLRIELFIVLSVVSIAFVPMPQTSIEKSSITFKINPQCDSSDNPSVTVNASATGTRYDQTLGTFMPDDQAIYIPFWWNAVFAISGGITQELIAKTKCVPDDIRELKQLIADIEIKDPILREEVNQFYGQCFIPSRSKIAVHKPILSDTIPIDDINCLDSAVFRSATGYYDWYQAKEMVRGWPYDPVRDEQHYGASSWGYPYCNDWWEGPEAGSGEASLANPPVGLRYKIIEHAGPTLLQKFKRYFDLIQTEAQHAAAETEIICSAIEFESELLVNRTLEEEASSVSFNPIDFGLHLGSKLGILKEQLSFAPTVHMMKIAAPIVQSTVLMVLIALLPFYMVFSAYRLDNLVFMSVVILSVKLWSFLFAFANWADNALWRAYNDRYHNMFMGVDWQVVDSVSEDLTQFIAGMLYIVLPILLSMMMGWAGYQMNFGDVVEKLTSNLKNSGKRAGEVPGKAVDMLKK